MVIDPKICYGKPVFKGTRVLVSDILEMLAGGMSIDEILEEYPQLNREMVLEAIALAAELLRRERRAIPLPT
ncbi:MAG: antitoxin [Thermoprotei archaeon]|nr:MAG: antitoxin [Thermoprotei archaeon]